MLGPILQLKDELFQTFRQRRSIVSVGEYETDKASLERMLADFEADFAHPGQVRAAPGILHPAFRDLAFHCVCAYQFQMAPLAASL